MNSKKILTNEIPVIFFEEDKGKMFPENYGNNLEYWGNISRENLHTDLPDGTCKLLHLDIDFGNRCGLNCPHCFRRKGFDKVDDPLNYKQIVNYVREGKSLGLQSLKILGRGEPFESPNGEFLRFLHDMTSLEIGVGIFTKGHVLGSNVLCQQFYEMDCKQLIAELKQLNVSILLGFNSFDQAMQQTFTGVDQYPVSSPLKDYVRFRDQALVNLVKAGFNEYVPGETTRLAMISAPVKPENVDQVFDQYTWARMRNIYMLSCPTTVSGRGKDEYEREREEFDYNQYLSQLENLYVQIYIWNIETGLMTIEQFKEEGVSLYPGCHPCNQVACGMYLNLSGQVVMCPGRVDESTIFTRDIRQTTLKDV